MKHMLILTLVVLFQITGHAQTTNTCDPKVINSQISMNVLSQDQTSEKTFTIVSCESNIYVAKEVVSDETTTPTIIEIKSKTSEFAEIRFIKKNPGDSFSPIVPARWYKNNNSVVFDTPQMVSAAPAMECKQIGPQKCSEGCFWNPDHKMCMPNDEGTTNLNFHINQFFVTSSSSGPRGTTAFSAPNMWMLEVNHQLASKNIFAVNWMGTSDKWTVPTSGYPLLLQSGESNAAGVPYVDAQHPHTSPVMGLTFSDIIKFGDEEQNKLTFFFAPRGQATAGPQAFMHRPSASINPDAPLAHHLQDVFHITSTVVGVKLNVNNTTLEASVFSGVEPSPAEVTLDMHKPDSYAFRVNQDLNENFSVGGSYAKTKATHRGESTPEADDETALSAWLSTSHLVKKGFLNTSFIWGQVTNKQEGTTLNGFLEEFVYQLGKNNFYGRVEVLQRTPQQLNIVITDGKSGAKWIKPLTIGYEHTLVNTNSLDLGLGGAFTKNYLPTEFKTTYGGNPYAGKVYLRLGWGKNKSWK